MIKLLDGQNGVEMKKWSFPVCTECEKTYVNGKMVDYFNDSSANV